MWSGDGSRLFVRDDALCLQQNRNCAVRPGLAFGKRAGDFAQAVMDLGAHSLAAATNQSAISVLGRELPRLCF